MSRRSAHGPDYGPSHRRERKQWVADVTAGHVNCWRCGDLIYASEPWDLGHDDHDHTQYKGPEHRHCNRSAGAAQGNRNRGRVPCSRDW